MPKFVVKFGERVMIPSRSLCVDHLVVNAECSDDAAFAVERLTDHEFTIEPVQNPQLIDVFKSDAVKPMMGRLANDKFKGGHRPL